MQKKLTAAGIGPGQRDCLTLAALSACKRAGVIYAHTARSEAVQYLLGEGISISFLDACFEASLDFDDLGQAVYRELYTALSICEDVLLLLPGEGLAAVGYADQVRRAAADAGAQLICLPGVSPSTWALDTAGMAGDLTPMQQTYASQIAAFSPDVRLPLAVLELGDKLQTAEVKLKLLDAYPDDWQVTLVSGIPPTLRRLPLHELDQQAVDHTSVALVWPVPLVELERFGMPQLEALMDRLRLPGGCPWDAKQTHESLLKNLVEECYELVDAIQNADEQGMVEELGDVLMQVVFHACIAKQQGRFDLTDVSTEVCKKLILRHPHIFGNVSVRDADQVVTNWNKIKKKEKGQVSQSDVLRDVPQALPALMRASKLQARAGQVGFDWDTPQEALDKVREETDEVADALVAGDRATVAEELGDLLFAVVNVARLAKCDAEEVARLACDKFTDRFCAMEVLIQTEGKSFEMLSLPQMDTYWERVKAKK